MRYTARVIAHYDVEVEAEDSLGVPAAAAAAVRLAPPRYMEIDRIWPAPMRASEMLARLKGEGDS